MLKNMLMIILTVILNTAGQFMIKAGVNEIVSKTGKIDFSNLLSWLLKAAVNGFVLGGFFSYALSAVLWIVILSRAQLSWAFPMVSLSYVITALVAPVLLNEAFSYMRFIGILIICLGVFFVSRT
ncbi:MAG: EamA family transporter [Candidatus Krumholzibacteriota bacterium]|nr:EamA family transporter [Candidatus Krumholzibacteriota bacterium]